MPDAPLLDPLFQSRNGASKRLPNLPEAKEPEERKEPKEREEHMDYDLDLEFNEQHSEESIKGGFIRKVYAILGIQMAYTSLIVSAMTFNPPLGCEGVWYLTYTYILMIPLICVFCGLKKRVFEFPTNFMLLAVLTTKISVPLGGIVFSLYSMGKGAIILASVIMTSIIFFTLTAGAFVGDKFGWPGNFIFVAPTLLPLLALLAYNCFFDHLMGFFLSLV